VQPDADLPTAQQTAERVRRIIENRFAWAPVRAAGDYGQPRRGHAAPGRGSRGAAQSCRRRAVSCEGRGRNRVVVAAP